MKKSSAACFVSCFFALCLCVLLWACHTIDGARTYSLDARQTWGAQRNMPALNEQLLEKNPVLYYQLAHESGRSPDTQKIIESLENLLIGEEAKSSAYRRLGYLQSLYALGAAGEKEVHQAKIDFVREIAQDFSPGVAIAMLGSFIPLSSLNNADRSFFENVAHQNGIHIPGSRAGGLGELSKKDWFDGVVTVWVRAGYLMQQGLSFPKISLGTGFFIDKQGYLVTNYHVIAPYVERASYSGFSEITIEPAGSKTGRRMNVRVIGYSKETDLALLKVDDYVPQVTFSFADKADVHTGDRVYALGSPGGQTETLTSGLVSHTERRMIMPIGNVIQLDAAVNPGNSGGPMLNDAGNIAGVIFATHTSFQGLSFALSTDTVRAVLPLLMMAEGKAAALPFVGLGMTEVENGVEASLVMSGSLIERAGFTSGASLLEVAGVFAGTQDQVFADLQLGLLRCFANTLTRIVLRQDDKTQEVTVRLARRSNRPALDVIRTTPIFALYGPMFGMVLRPLSNRMMFVQRVYPGSQAAMAGIKPKDTLVIYQTMLSSAEGQKQPSALVSIFRVTLETDAGMPRNMVLGGALDANYWL